MNDTARNLKVAQKILTQAADLVDQLGQDVGAGSRQNELALSQDNGGDVRGINHVDSGRTDCIKVPLCLNIVLQCSHVLRGVGIDCIGDFEQALQFGVSYKANTVISAKLMVVHHPVPFTDERSAAHTENLNVIRGGVCINGGPCGLVQYP